MSESKCRICNKLYDFENDDLCLYCRTFINEVRNEYCLQANEYHQTRNVFLNWLAKLVDWDWWVK